MGRRDKVRVVSREAWGAQPAKETKPLDIPVPHVIIFPETDTEVCYHKKECIALLQEIQKGNMENEKLPDIKYNFLVGLDGRIYEGTGWTTQSASIMNYPEMDGKFISIAYIGNFEDWTPPYRMLAALEQFIEHGVDEEYIDRQYTRADVVYPSGDLDFDDDCRKAMKT